MNNILKQKHTYITAHLESLSIIKCVMKASDSFTGMMKNELDFVWVDLAVQMLECHENLSDQELGGPLRQPRVLIGQNHLQHVACHWSEIHVNASSHWTESSPACRLPLVRNTLKCKFSLDTI